MNIEEIIEENNKGITEHLKLCNRMGLRIAATIAFNELKDGDVEIFIYSHYTPEALNGIITDLYNQFNPEAMRSIKLGKLD